MNPIISASDLLLLRSQKELVLIDARSSPTAKQNYENNHLEGARWVDLEQDLSEKTDNAAQGGRHPLPPVIKFAQFLGKLGITPQSQVIVYDDKNGTNAAARFWWMLRAVGHQKVQVLDGGFQAAMDARFPTNSGIETPNPTVAYPTDVWHLPMADMEEVAQAANASDAMVIDVRDADRYAGKTEPIDLIAGHIPGAINIPFTENLDTKGFYLSPAELKTKYEAAIGDFDAEKVIVHCGSGVTACHTLLAMAQSGMEIPKLYVGSWSEWSRNDRPMAGESG